MQCRQLTWRRKKTLRRKRQTTLWIRRGPPSPGHFQKSMLGELRRSAARWRVRTGVRRAHGVRGARHGPGHGALPGKGAWRRKIPPVDDLSWRSQDAAKRYGPRSRVKVCFFPGRKKERGGSAPCTACLFKACWLNARTCPAGGARRARHFAGCSISSGMDNWLPTIAAAQCGQALRAAQLPTPPRLGAYGLTRLRLAKQPFEITSRRKIRGQGLASL